MEVVFDRHHARRDLLRYRNVLLQAAHEMAPCTQVATELERHVFQSTGSLAHETPHKGFAEMSNALLSSDTIGDSAATKSISRTCASWRLATPQKRANGQGDKAEDEPYGTCGQVMVATWQAFQDNLPQHDIMKKETLHAISPRTTLKEPGRRSMVYTPDEP